MSLVDGLVLAALAAGDPQGAACRGGLAGGLAQELAARLAELASLGSAERRARVEALAAASQPPSTPPPPLAGDADPALQSFLRRVSSRVEPDAEARERAAPALAPLEAHLSRAAEAFAGEDRERVVGALRLGARGATGGDERSRAWRACGAELAMLREGGWLG